MDGDKALVKNLLSKLGSPKLLDTPKILSRSYGLIIITVMVLSNVAWSNQVFAEDNPKRSSGSVLSPDGLAGIKPKPEPIPDDLIDVPESLTTHTIGGPEHAGILSPDEIPDDLVPVNDPLPAPNNFLPVSEDNWVTLSADEEIQLLDKEISRNSNNGEAHFRRGIFYYEKRHLEPALKDFLKAKKLGYSVEPQLLDELKNLIAGERQQKGDTMRFIIVEILITLILSASILFLVRWLRSRKSKQLIAEKISFISHRSQLLQTFSFLFASALLLFAFTNEFFYFIEEFEDTHTWLTLVVFFISVITAVKSYSCKLNRWATVFAFSALLFNPIFKYHFDQGAWKALYALSGIFFLVALFKLDLHKIKPAAKE